MGGYCPPSRTEQSAIMSESKTSQRRVAATKRQAAAMELRGKGYTFEKIAEELGYRGPSGAFRAVSAGLDKTLREPAASLRVLESERLDRLLEGVWKKAAAGNVQGVRAVLAILERRAKLWGLDAPTRYEMSQVLASADGAKVCEAIMGALKPWPEAAEAVGAALRGMTGE